MRLIDADALDQEMYHKSFEVDDGRNVWNSGLWIRYKIFEEAIRDAPTVDAVPVIRCKDCKRWETDDGMFKDIDERQWHHCPHIGIDTDEYFFCSEAEKKKNETGNDRGG